jgi:hypothetical protein
MFEPLLRGGTLVAPGPVFWCIFASATFFLGFGLAARSHLAETWRRLLNTPGR